jgi:hypothetical protein
MRRTYAWRNGALIELSVSEIQAIPNVQDDIAEFRSPDGKRIRGKAQWREHLKRTGTIEMGHSDMRNVQEKWGKKREAFAQKVSRGTEGVKEVAPREGEIRPRELSRVDTEMANRLYNRPMPDRKTLIKLSLETARHLIKR